MLPLFLKRNRLVVWVKKGSFFVLFWVLLGKRNDRHVDMLDSNENDRKGN